MYITEKKLFEGGAFIDLDKYFSCMNRKRWDAAKLLDYCISEGELSDSEYIIFALMSENQQRKWAVYNAESVLHIYEKEYPDDKRPRQAIKAAKRYLNNPSDKNGTACSAAMYAAMDAAMEATRSAAWYAAIAAARSAARCEARDAAWYAAWADAMDADRVSAWGAATAAAWDAARDAARDAHKEKLLRKGLEILLGNEK